MTPQLLASLLAIFLISGCIEDEELLSTDESEATCATSSSTYTPYVAYAPSGSVAALPWRGHATSYPAGDEDFRGYALPSTIECSSARSRRSHLDVTAGCLSAVAVGDYSRAQIKSTSGGAFRVLALGYTDGSDEPIKWTDQSNQYRFYYTGTSGAGVDPGFKAFVRYRTEDDLYVASWRVDGHVQIKKKQCGKYTTLAQVKRSGPSRGAWHWIRFDAIGNQLHLYLDGTRVLSVTDSTFSWGTAGIRTDAMTGAYLDDWTVQAP